MKSRGYIILLLASFLFAASCVRQDPPVDPASGSTSIMDCYYSSVCFAGAEVTPDGVDIYFSDGNIVHIAPDATKVLDCRVKDFPEMAADASRGDWTYNRVHSGVSIDMDVPDRNAKIVCLAFSTEELRIYLNNGSELIIPDEIEKNLHDFFFATTENKSLKEDLRPQMDHSEIVFSLPAGSSDLAMTPTFRIRGKSLTCSGTYLVSGKVGIDFTDDVTIELTLYDNTVLEYHVLLKKEGAFPTIYLTTNGPVNSKDKYVKGTIRIEDESLANWSTRKFEASMSIKGRGNSTWNMPKKPYRIKLDEKAKIFGLPANRDWVLLANYADKTLLRNAVAMKISEILGFSWTPAIFHVEVYMNGSYLGLYSFMDHKEVAKHRVEIETVTDQDNSGQAVEGGYYLEVEEAMDEAVVWWTDMGVPMMFKDPENPTRQQQQYVKDYFKSFEGVLRSSNYADPKNGYAKYIDVESFAKNYIINELTKNVDGNLRKSTFLTKERGKKLEMYHVWDFDFTLGNCDYFDEYYGLTNTYEGWFIRYCGRTGHGSGWYYILMKDPNFVKVVVDIWNKVYPQLKEVSSYIDSMYEFVEPAAERNFQKWNILNTYVWPNYVYFGDYKLEVEYLKKFYNNRLEWLNAELNNL